MTDKIFQETKQRMQAQLEHLHEELRSIRAGRATSALLEPVIVEVYGSEMRLKEVASITTPEPRQLVVTPFDTANVQHVAKSIDKANLGVRAIVEGKSVRVMFPELTQDRRKQLIGQAHEKREKCKVAIRNVRRDQNETAKKKKGSGEITEDDQKRLEKQIQELTDKSCKDVDDMVAAKEKEISTI